LLNVLEAFEEQSTGCFYDVFKWKSQARGRKEEALEESLAELWRGATVLSWDKAAWQGGSNKGGESVISFVAVVWPTFGEKTTQPQQQQQQFKTGKTSS